MNEYLLPKSLLFLTVIITIRVISVFFQIRRVRYLKRYDPFPKMKAKTLIVLGSGGHTTEMLNLIESIKRCSTYAHKYEPLNYVVAASDVTSIARLGSFDLLPHKRIYNIPRSREVGQNYISSIFTTIYSMFYSALIVLYEAPDLVLMNGPGTCLPIALSTFLSRVLGLGLGRIVFCESFCRVKNLSLTGKILEMLGIIDLFFVHWPDLSDGNPSRVLIDAFITHYD